MQLNTVVEEYAGWSRYVWLYGRKCFGLVRSRLVHQRVRGATDGVQVDLEDQYDVDSRSFYSGKIFELLAKKSPHSWFGRRRSPSPSMKQLCRLTHFSSGRTGPRSDNITFDLFWNFRYFAEPPAASSCSRTRPPCQQQRPSSACTSGSCPGSSSRRPPAGSRPPPPPSPAPPRGRRTSCAAAPDPPCQRAPGSPRQTGLPLAQLGTRKGSISYCFKCSACWFIVN